MWEKKQRKEAEDTYERWKPRPSKIPAGGKERSGVNLSDVLRDLFEEWREDRNLTQAAAAEYLGVSQSSVSRFESGQDAKMRLLTALCIAREMTPVQLISTHPSYASSGGKVSSTRKLLFQRFKELFRNDEARNIVTLLEDAERLGVLDRGLQLIEELVVAHSPNTSSEGDADLARK